MHECCRNSFFFFLLLSVACSGLITYEVTPAYLVNASGDSFENHLTVEQVVLTINVLLNKGSCQNVTVRFLPIALDIGLKSLSWTITDAENKGLNDLFSFNISFAPSKYFSANSDEMIGNLSTFDVFLTEKISNVEIRVDPDPPRSQFSLKYTGTVLLQNTATAPFATWSEAKQLCMDRGGNLSSWRTTADISNFYDAAGETSGEIWIGGYSSTYTKIFCWAAAAGYINAASSCAEGGDYRNSSGYSGGDFLCSNSIGCDYAPGTPNFASGDAQYALFARRNAATTRYKWFDAVWDRTTVPYYACSGNVTLSRLFDIDFNRTFWLTTLTLQPTDTNTIPRTRTQTLSLSQTATRYRTGTFSWSHLATATKSFSSLATRSVTTSLTASLARTLSQELTKSRSSSLAATQSLSATRTSSKTLSRSPSGSKITQSRTQSKLTFSMSRSETKLTSSISRTSTTSKSKKTSTDTNTASLTPLATQSPSPSWTGTFPMTRTNSLIPPTATFSLSTSRFSRSRSFGSSTWSSSQTSSGPTQTFSSPNTITKNTPSGTQSSILSNTGSTSLMATKTPTKPIIISHSLQPTLTLMPPRELTVIEEAAKQAKDITSIGVAITSAIAGGGSVIAITQISRSSLVLGLRSCIPDDEALDWVQHPTAVEIGSTPTIKAFVGATLMNPTLLIGMTSTLALIAYFYSVINDVPINDAHAKLHFPSFLAFPFLFFLDPTVMSAVTVIIHGELHEQFLAIISGVGIVGLIVLITYRLRSQFHAELFNAPEDQIAAWKIALFGTARWNDAPGHSGFCRRFRMFFNEYSGERYWYFSVELIMTFFTGVLEGFKLGSGKCQVVGILFALLLLIYGAMIIFRRPYLAKFSHYFNLFLTIVQLVGALAFLLWYYGGSERSFDVAIASATLSLYVVLLSSVVTAVKYASAYIWWKTVEKIVTVREAWVQRDLGKTNAVEMEQALVAPEESTPPKATPLQLEEYFEAELPPVECKLVEDTGAEEVIEESQIEVAPPSVDVPLRVRPVRGGLRRIADECMEGLSGIDTQFQDGEDPLKEFFESPSDVLPANIPRLKFLRQTVLKSMAEELEEILSLGPETT